MTIPIHYYIAFNNPSGAIQVMKDFNYQVLNVKSKADLGQSIARFIQLEGEKGLRALAKIHPDRDLILETQEIKTGADGIQDLISSMPGTSTVAPAGGGNNAKPDYIPLLIGGCLASALLLSAAIIAKK